MATKKVEPQEEKGRIRTEGRETRKMDKSSVGASRRILWVGVGDLPRKCAYAMQKYRDAGVEIHGVDINEDPVGKDAVPLIDFYHAANPKDMRRLVDTARQIPFDLVYIANYPEVHLIAAFEWQRLARSIVIAKPLDTHLELFRTIIDHRDAFQDFLDKMVVHDHYRNKPGVGALRFILDELHAQYGYVNKVRLFLVESKSIEEEWHRVRALECGMIFDLGVHLVSLLQELVPRRIKWEVNGQVYERLGRRIEVAACARARSEGCVLNNQESETFAVIELKITETLHHQPTNFRFARSFPVLLVMGRGSNVDAGVGRDLKAVEIKFEGVTVQLNLDTHCFSGGDVGSILGRRHYHSDKAQRGLNAPLLRLLNQNLDPMASSSGPLALFQTFEDAWENTQILDKARKLSKRDLFSYRVGVPCHDLVNRLIADGRLDSKWLMPQPLTHLLIGQLLRNAVP